MSQSPLILPGSLEYELTLGATLPPGWQKTRARYNGDFGFIVRPGSSLLEAVPIEEFNEYALGGEWDKRLEEIGELEPDLDA